MSEPATIPEIVETFNRLEPREILDHNWGTCGWDCPAVWAVNGETYINGVLMTIDLDYIVGYLLEVVDRTTRNHRYPTVVRYHGRFPDDTIEHTYDEGPSGPWQSFEYIEDTVRWAVSSIYRQVHNHRE